MNSTDGWNSIGCMSFYNQPILKYSSEIRSAVLLVHGDKAVANDNSMDVNISDNTGMHPHYVVGKIIELGYILK